MKGEEEAAVAMAELTAGGKARCGAEN